MTNHTITHGSFTLTRQLKATPTRAFAAFAEPARKRRWFVDTPGFTTFDYQLDCREAGEEFWHGRAPDGTEITMTARFAEVRAAERLLLTYEMTLNGRRLSLSLLSVEFRAADGGTTLTLTEQVAPLDGMGTTEDRKLGTEGLLDALAAYLDG